MRHESALVLTGSPRPRGGPRLRPRYLVAEHDELLAASLARFLRQFGDAMVVGTAEDATRLLAERRTWSAFVLDAALPDGSGLDVLARARAVYPSTPALVVTDVAEAETINGAYDLGADVVVKPFDVWRIERFVIASGESFAARLDSAVVAWSARYGLSDAQTDILRRAARGDRRDSIAQARGAAETTVKTQIRMMLRRTGDGALHLAVERMLRAIAGQ